MIKICVFCANSFTRDNAAHSYFSALLGHMCTLCHIARISEEERRQMRLDLAAENTRFLRVEAANQPIVKTYDYVRPMNKKILLLEAGL